MIKEFIKSYKDFPKEGIDFKCTASLCASEKGFARANNYIYQNLLKYMPVDKIIGILDLLATSKRGVLTNSLLAIFI